jgi:hypothetical protein
VRSAAAQLLGRELALPLIRKAAFVLLLPRDFLGFHCYLYGDLYMRRCGTPLGR